MTSVFRSSRGLSEGVISASFLLTGVGTAMLGSALPAMLTEWHLNDRDGGWLLFSAFAGSTLGAALVQRPRPFVPALGMLMSAAGLFYAALIGARLPYPGLFFYGLGLGVTMTAISLIQSRAVGPSGNHREMNRLNLLWAAGACCAPPFALHSLQHISVDFLLRAASILLLLSGTCLAATATASLPDVTASRKAHVHRVTDPFAPLRLCLFAGAAVGLESAIGSWLTTYTQRRVHASGVALSATALFWFGLLLSRLLHSIRAGYVFRSRQGVAFHLASVALSAVLLTAIPRGAALLCAAFLAGWGLGPLYPLALSIALPRYRSGAVFVTAGIGAAVLPWCTGALSSATHSLRIGLLAPCCTVLLLTAAAFWMRSELPEPLRVPA